MAELIFVRHGESVWNKENVFTGWIDVPLSEKGWAEARSAGRKLSEKRFNEVHVSHMVRAYQTLMAVLDMSSDERIPVVFHPEDPILAPKEKHGFPEDRILPVFQSWRLAERCYGDLQGLNKARTAERFGSEQVHIWRRSYDVRPPAGESLKDTLERVLPYWKDIIVPSLGKGEERSVLVVAHGNSLRAMTKYLEGISDEEIPKVEIPTGIPIRYEVKVTDTTVKVLSKEVL